MAADESKAVKLLREAIAAGLDFGQAHGVFSEQRTERELQIVEMARANQDEGTLEVDDVAIVSEGDDNGAYVEAWLWVPFAGTPLDKDDEEESAA